MVSFAALGLVFKNKTPTQKEETNIKKVSIPLVNSTLLSH